MFIADFLFFACLPSSIVIFLFECIFTYRNHLFAEFYPYSVRVRDTRLLAPVYVRCVNVGMGTLPTEMSSYFSKCHWRNMYIAHQCRQDT